MATLEDNGLGIDNRSSFDRIFLPAEAEFIFLSGTLYALRGGAEFKPRRIVQE